MDGMSKCVFALLETPIDTVMVARAARSFGWNATPVQSLRDLQCIDSDRIAAVLFDCKADGGNWFTSAARLRVAAPGVRLIACHHFSDELDWPALCDAGVFHAIRIPLREEELRQSLGYAWALDRQALESRKLPVVAMSRAAALGRIA